MANNAPTFDNDLISVTFIQGADAYSFNIPNYIDPDGNAVIFTWVQTGTSTQPTFIAFDGTQFTIRADASTTPGTYPITMTITDCWGVYTTSSFNVIIVLNTAPFFSPAFSAITVCDG